MPESCLVPDGYQLSPRSARAAWLAQSRETVVVRRTVKGAAGVKSMSSQPENR